MFLHFFFHKFVTLFLKNFCFGEIKKLIAKNVAEVRTILEPAAILNVYPTNNPNIDEKAPNIDDIKIIVDKLVAYK